MATKKVLVGLPAIPGHPGESLGMQINIDDSKVGSPGIEIEQKDGPRVLVENQNGCMTVYVWKSLDDVDYGRDPLKVQCQRGAPRKAAQKKQGGKPRLSR